MSEKLDISVSKLRDGSHTSTGSTAGHGVGSAGGHLLGGQGGEAAGGNGGVGLDHFGGGEGPA